MCGIIGKTGINNVVPELINGLKSLEYRGYDSSGIAVINNGKIRRFRASGKISELEKELGKYRPESEIGIGHTRWATHGSPTKENAHPHISPKGKFALVHNGIIENAEEIKKNILPPDREYSSKTDTEVAVHLLEKYYDGDPIKAIVSACNEIKGSYAFGILCEDFPNTLFAVASASPLVAVKSEKGSYIASDLCAVKGKTDSVYRLTDGEICSVEHNEIRFFDSKGKQIRKTTEKISVDAQDLDKGEYEHFMIKEIMQQPQAVRNTVESLVSKGKIILPDVSITSGFFKNELSEIVIVACGSAYHTGLVGKNVIEPLCKVPCNVQIASEFRYSEPLVNENTLAVFISQSGETADTLAALRLAKKWGAQVLSIVNVKGSAIAEESDNVIYTKAGREIAVATTKAYSAQLIALYALGIFIAKQRGKITSEQERNFVEEMGQLPQKISETLESVNEDVKKLAKEIFQSPDIFYIGRLSDYATASEGSLKMKEITYINSQVYAAGELKHGTISLINEGTPVVAIASQREIFSKTLSNMAEVSARGAKVIAVTDEELKSDVTDADKIITVSNTLEEFKGSLLVLPLQLLSYYTAKLRGCNIDKPKNLAKSVTVE